MGSLVLVEQVGGAPGGLVSTLVQSASGGHDQLKVLGESSELCVDLTLSHLRLVARTT